MWLSILFFYVVIVYFLQKQGVIFHVEKIVGYTVIEAHPYVSNGALFKIDNPNMDFINHRENWNKPANPWK